MIFLVLILVNVSMYPVYLDIPYHMAVTRGFREAGGVTTWDYWDYAPQGRPHLYPPLLHVGMSLLQDLGLSEESVAVLICLAMFPLIMLALWFTMRKLFGSRAAFFSLVLLCVPYAFFWQTGITIAASLVLVLTPLLFLALEKDRRLAAGLLLAMCLYSHLVLGHLLALALLLYLFHRRDHWKRICTAVGLAYLLYLPWGLVVLTNLSGLRFSEPGGGGNLALHLFLWIAALAGLFVCYRKKRQYYLLPSYLFSMIPMAFFYSHRFWEGHVFLSLAMLGAVALDRLCAALHGALSGRGVAAATSRRAVAVLAGAAVLLLLLVDPVFAVGGTKARGGMQPGVRPDGQGTALPPLGRPSPHPGSLRAQAANRLRDRLREAGEGRGGSPRIAVEPTSFLALSGLEEAGKRDGVEQDVFGEENRAMLRAVEENSRAGDVVFVVDGRLGNLIYAMTGRYATKGMFHEVQPAEETRPLQGIEDADLAVIGGQRGPGAEAGIGIVESTGGLGGWEPVAREGRYLILARQGSCGAGGGTSQAAVPLGVAYALLTLAAVAGAWDLFRRGPILPRGGGEVDPARLPRVEDGGAPSRQPGQGSLMIIGEASLGKLSVGESGERKDRGHGEERVAASTLVLVPAYDEAACVGRLVWEIGWKYPGMDVLVLDDGSRDDTAELAYGAGAAVLRSAENRGIGEMMRYGLSFAYRRGYRFAVRLDGDGQHPPDYIPAMLQPLARGEAEVVVGSRFLSDGAARGDSSLFRRAGMAYFRYILRKATGRSFSDPTSGFHAYSREAMRFFAARGSRRYPEVFSLLLLARGGFRVREVEVVMRPRRYGRSTIGLREALSMVAGASACLLPLPRRKAPGTAFPQACRPPA